MPVAVAVAVAMAMESPLPGPPVPRGAACRLVFSSAELELESSVTRLAPGLWPVLLRFRSMTAAGDTDTDRGAEETIARLIMHGIDGGRVST
jgi:hypothetical protein